AGGIDDRLADVDEITVGRALDAADWEASPLYIFDVGSKCWNAVALTGRCCCLDLCSAVVIAWRQRSCEQPLLQLGARLPQGVHLPLSLPLRVLPICSLLPVVHGQCGLRREGTHGHAASSTSRFGVAFP